LSEPQVAASRHALLEVRGVRVDFRTERGWLRAVDGVDLELDAGETLGLVGESGCGKSTLARAIAGLLPLRAGSIRVAGEELGAASSTALRRIRRRLQLVFQDPFASLNPRLTAASIVGEPLRIHGLAARRELDARVCELFELVGLDASLRRRYPHEFSGGQRQRIGLARALALEPDLLLLDEPVSALDVSIQAQILNLLVDLRRRLGLSILFIAHNLAVVRHVSDRVAVMYLGQVVEVAPRDALYGAPLHPYTEALLSAVPVPDPDVEAQRRRIRIEGEVPSAAIPISGCPFRTRCPRAEARCAVERPVLEPRRAGHAVACHRPGA
jgi:oligopeptide/dipeptide ABC transporter ATP-binding protein